MQNTGQRSQAAMEYLITYGWAILVIAVVFGSLLVLGVFNPNYFAPKASPGSCSVVRPFGPGTTKLISLSGTCNNELPQYVSQFDGKSTYITVSNNPITGSSAFTIMGWMKINKMTTYGLAFTVGTASSLQSAYIGYIMAAQGGTANSIGGGPYGYNIGSGVSDSSWHFVTLSYIGGTSGTITLYVDGVQKSTTTNTLNLQATAITMGKADTGTAYWYNGSLSNLQIYNVALPSNSIMQLYLEGIGGVPIDYNNLVGWWPLNGDMNDYSGNARNGVPTNVVFVNTWYSSYTPP